MKTCPSVPTVHTPRLFSILLLAVALNAQKESWDNPICTEGVLSVPRGSRAEITCSISNIFRDVTIELTAGGKNRTIFNQKPPGNYSNDSWQLRIQGGQAELLIADAQDIHNGLYLWRLRGHQQEYRRITLNVSAEPSNVDEAKDMRVSTSPSVNSPQLEARTATVVVAVIATIVILGFVGISIFFCYRNHHSSNSQWICTSEPDLRIRRL